MDFVGQLFNDADYALPTDVISAPEELDASDTEVNIPCQCVGLSTFPLWFLSSVLVHTVCVPIRQRRKEMVGYSDDQIQRSVHILCRTARTGEEACFGEAPARGKPG